MDSCLWRKTVSQTFGRNWGAFEIHINVIMLHEQKYSVVWNQCFKGLVNIWNHAQSTNYLHVKPRISIFMSYERDIMFENSALAKQRTLLTILLENFYLKSLHKLYVMTNIYVAHIREPFIEHGFTKNMIWICNHIRRTQLCLISTFEVTAWMNKYIP